MNFLKKNLTRSLSKVILALSVFLTPAFSLYAACDPGKFCNPIDVDTINDFIRVVLDGALEVGIPVVAVAVIYSGFLFVKARGNSEELTKAKDALLYTLIGAAILLGSWAIAQVIARTVLAL